MLIKIYIWESVNSELNLRVIFRRNFIFLVLLTLSSANISHVIRSILHKVIIIIYGVTDETEGFNVKLVSIIINRDYIPLFLYPVEYFRWRASAMK